jgi:hypothetical protein
MSDFIIPTSTKAYHSPHWLIHHSFIHLAQKNILFKILNIYIYYLFIYLYIFWEAQQHTQLDKPLAPQILKLIGKGLIKVSPTLHYIFIYL